MRASSKSGHLHRSRPCRLRLTRQLVLLDDLRDLGIGLRAVLLKHIGTISRIHGSGELRAFARLDNLANRRYAGSVIVNNTSAQYFEAGPGRAFLVGLSFQLR